MRNSPFVVASSILDTTVVSAMIGTEIEWKDTRNYTFSSIMFRNFILTYNWVTEDLSQLHHLQIHFAQSHHLQDLILV